MSGQYWWYPPGPPPPLPPRSPRPAEPVSYSPAYYAQYGSLPPPPPGPPPRSPGVGPVPSNIPPPIPPRPPGYESPAPHTHSYNLPNPPPAVSVAHHEAPSEPIMSANLPWISHGLDDTPNQTQMMPNAPAIPPKDHRGSRPSNGGTSYAPYNLSTESQSGQPQYPPQNHTVASGMVESFGALSVSENPTSSPSNYQHGSNGSFPPPLPPPPPPNAPSAYTPGHHDMNFQENSGLGTNSFPPPSSPAPPSNITPGGNSFQPPEYSLPPRIDITPTHSAPATSTPASSAASASQAAAQPPSEPHPSLPPLADQRDNDKHAYRPYTSERPSVKLHDTQAHLPQSTSVSPAPPPAMSLPVETQSNTPPQATPILPEVISPPLADLTDRGKQSAADHIPTPILQGDGSKGCPKAVAACIDGPVTFATTWYTHPSAPDFFICSRCYCDHIYPSRYRHEFGGMFLDDNMPRLCRFSKRRMLKHLFPEAISRGTLQDALEWMKRRATIPDCKGVQGAKGSEGVKWFKPKNGDIPNFISCEACYEDYCLTNSLASFLQPATNAQGESETWVCDMAIPFIGRAYIEFGKSNAWATFAEEASIRLHRILACPGQQRVPITRTKWYKPVSNSLEGWIICAACYCDQVLLTPETGKWREATEVMEASGAKASCDLAEFNNLTPMLISHDREDYSIFWTAINEIARQPHCDGKGIENATWYTLSSHPPGFEVCGACQAGVLKPLRVDGFFVQCSDVPPGKSILCSFNNQYSRRNAMVQKLLELYWTHDPKSLEQYAIDYATTPPCKVDEDYKNGVWYGWDNCTICRECYLEFVRGTALAEKMPLQGVVKAESCVCEMYSRRMRGLYLEACEKGDSTELLQFSEYRRSVYYQTVPECRMLVFQAKMNLTRQQMLNTTASFYSNLGAMQEINMPSAFTYSSPGIGGGYHNQNEIQGAVYAKQGWNTFVNGQAFITNAKVRVQELQNRWREVE